MKLTFRYKGGSGSGHFGHSGRPGKVGGSISTSLPDGKYVQDNPSVRPDATPDQLDYARTHPNSSTAYFRGLYVDPRALMALNIGGKMKEERNINQARVEQLAESMRKDGFLKNYPPLICVEQDGTPKVWEGNHRIRAAVLAGIEAIPLDVRYFGGGETVPGIFSPQAVRSISENFIDS